MAINPDNEVLASLVEIYGSKVPQYLQWIKDDHPEMDFNQLVNAYKKDPTSTQTSFSREPNIGALAWLISQDQSKDWYILSAGCGKGPEPYELAMRLIKDGKTNFKIDGFDVSDEVIEEAKKGVFAHALDYGSYFERKLFPPLIKANILLQKGTQYQRTRFRYVDYEASPDVKANLNFAIHDFIEGPVKPPQHQVYDVAICNNVLMHYPTKTRELILGNLTANLKAGGIVALEHNEMLGGFGSTQERINWLRPYYQWKTTLKRFGLEEDFIDGAGYFIPPKIYRYNPIG